MSLLAVQWLGTLPGWLTFLGLVAVGGLLLRGSMGPALGYYREANDALNKRNGELSELLVKERKANAALQAKTDIEPMQHAILKSMEFHESRATERHDKSMVILALIADRLGPNHDA